MVMTHGYAFKTFREDIVDLDPDDTKKARVSRDYLCDELKALAGREASFPRLSGGCVPFGSFARRTKIRPLNDIDVLLLLNGRGVQEHSPGISYEAWLWVADQTAPLAEFASEHGFVNSTRVLNRIKSLLPRIPSYWKTDPQKSGPAVRLELQSYDWGFDIVPAVPIANSIGTTLYYLIPDGAGRWERTDPRIDATNMTQLNQRHGSLILPTVRLLKYWNWRTHKPRLAPYHFETLALNMFRSAAQIPNIKKAIKFFFDTCPGHVLTTCPDPKNLGPNLDATVSADQKDRVYQAMKEAAEYVGYALMYEETNDDAKAIYWWGQVFGSNFPKYG